MNEQRHVDLGHDRQHWVDLGNISHARARVGGRARRVEFARKHDAAGARARDLGRLGDWPLARTTMKKYSDTKNVIRLIFDE